VPPEVAFVRRRSRQMQLNQMLACLLVSLAVTSGADRAFIYFQF